MNREKSIKSVKSIIETKRSELRVQESRFSKRFLYKCVNEAEKDLTERPTIKIYGKECQQNRYVRFFSDSETGYHYSSHVAKPYPLGKYLTRLLTKINGRCGTSFNGILVNKYVDGNDSIGKHSDNESLLGKDGVVALSVGAIRKFRIRSKSDGKIVLDLPTIEGDLISMLGDFQKEFTHEIPKEKKIKETRWSFTFRNHTDATKKKVKKIIGDLTKVKLGEYDYIAHQTNCKTKSSRGLASAIFKEYPGTNVYSGGVDKIPGKAIITKPVVHLFGQNNVGKKESSTKREAWFKEALQDLKSKDIKINKLYFPYEIGCGLAGGNWSAYKSMIYEFAKEVDYQIYIVRLP